MNETPRTDAEPMVTMGYHPSGLVTKDFARQLERENNSLAQRVRELEETHRETCTQCKKDFDPSVIESGWCIFCIVRYKDELIEKLVEAFNRIEQDFTDVNLHKESSSWICRSCGAEFSGHIKDIPHKEGCRWKQRHEALSLAREQGFGKEK